MKVKRKILTGFSVLFVLICLGSTILGYAAWRTEGRTTNRISLATVRGQIVEEYEQNIEIYPGANVNKKVEVVNTGNVNVITRVNVSKAWGDLLDGVFIPDPELSTDNIQAEYNTDDWLLVDEFYYYKRILSPGERSTPLMEAFTLSGDTGNAYAGKVGNIIVNMEIIQADGGAESFWGIAFEDLGIEYVPNTSEANTATVVFQSKTKGFAFDKNAGDLFIAYKNMVPGEVISQIVTVTNHETENVTINLWNEEDMKAAVPETQLALVKQLLKSYSHLTITDDTGDVIYSGGIWNEDNTLRVSLGNFKPGETKNLNLNLQISPEVGNDFKELAATVVWGFEAMGRETPVATGDTTNLLPYIIIASVSAALFVGLTIFNVKSKIKKST